MTTIDHSPQNILKRNHLKPHKGLGQNFLSDPAILEAIVQAAEIPANMPVLEIGPGLGSLTRCLSDHADRVIAVEIDHALIPVLKTELKAQKNVTIIESDIMKFDPAPYFPETGYSVVANIPYYITSQVIRHLLEASVRPNRMTLTVQKEVAERICAEQGKYSLLALSVQIYGKTSIPMIIPASAFYPVPKIDSAVVRIDLFDKPLISEEEQDDFFQLAKGAFRQKRKTIRNGLSSAFSLDSGETVKRLQEAGIDPNRRAETLSIDEWKCLTSVFFRKE